MFGGVRVLAREHARERLAWETERSRLIDQILHLSGKPWTPAPAAMAVKPPAEPEDLIEADQLP